MRKSIVTYKHENPLATFYHIANVFNINRCTVRNIIHVHDHESRVMKKAKGGAREGNRKFNNDHKEFIVDMQDENHDYTYKQIQQKYFNETKKKISLSVLQSIVHEADFTSKKLKTAPIERNTKEAKEYRAG